jgi:nucleotide-binding universal stress UspA family protein
MPSPTKPASRNKKPVLVPVDGSSSSLRAVARAIENARLTRCVVHLLNVQPAYDEYGMVPAYLSKARYRELRRARAQAALAPGLARVKRAAVRHVAHTAYGDTASSIVRTARRLRCGSIIMGTRGMGAIGSLLVGSVANGVIHLATIPVTLVK